MHQGQQYCQAKFHISEKFNAQWGWDVKKEQRL
jgi:hypothetical protein